MSSNEGMTGSVHRIVIEPTPKDTIRVWLYFKDDFDLNLNIVRDFNVMSLHGTYFDCDICKDDRCMAWNLPWSTAMWLREKFNKNSCSFGVANYFENMRMDEVFALMVKVPEEIDVDDITH